MDSWNYIVHWLIVFNVGLRIERGPLWWLTLGCSYIHTYIYIYIHIYMYVYIYIYISYVMCIVFENHRIYKVCSALNASSIHWNTEKTETHKIICVSVLDVWNKFFFLGNLMCLLCFNAFWINGAILPESIETQKRQKHRRLSVFLTWMWEISVFSYVISCVPCVSMFSKSMGHYFQKALKHRKDRNKRDYLCFCFGCEK